MKKLTISLNILLMCLFFGVTINGLGQTPFWSEDFSAYVSGTGIDGTGNIGDYPAGVTKWTLDVSNATLSDADDYIKTRYEKMYGKDLDGWIIWQSESIDISAYSSGVTFSLYASESGSMETSDYFDVYYKLDNGDFTLIPDWDGLGSVDHTLIDDFEYTTITQSTSSGYSLVIKVLMANNTSSEYHRFDNVMVYGNMAYASSTTTQNINKIAPERTNENIIGIEIETTGSIYPLGISNFTVNANGSTTPLSNNIENAKIFYTGTNNTFAATNQFGSVYSVPTTTDFDISGTQELSEGTNYFWITFDTKAGATIGDVVDAECISFVLDGTTQTPTITAPAGSRTLTPPLSGNYTIDATGDYISFTDAVDELMALGISAPVTFTVGNGTYTEQISLSAIDGTSATDTIIFQSGSGNRADVVLQYEPTSDPANHILKINGTDHITFQNMTLKNVGTSAFGRVIVFAGATNNINITGCNITGRDANHENNVDYTVITGEGGTSNMASNITFYNDTIRYGSYGLNFSGGDNDNLETGFRISNSVFEGFYYAGAFFYYQDSVVFHNNKLTGKGVYDYEYGMFLMYCYGDSEITANMVFLSAAEVNTGIRLLECHASAARSALIANNYFSQLSTGGAYGIDVSDCSYQKIYHNSINMRSSAKSGTGGKSYPTVGFYLDCMMNPLYGHIKLLNNIIYSNEMKISVSETAVNNDYLEESDNNVWGGSSLTDFGNWGDTNLEDLEALKLISGKDANSVAADAEFLSSLVPDIQNEALYGTVPMTEIIKDIYGNDRFDPTTPGAVGHNEIGGQLIAWTGNEDDSWNNPNNWDPPFVPGKYDDVWIPVNTNNRYPTLRVSGECNNLMVDNDAQLNVEDELEVNGNLQNMGEINTDFAGTLSLTGDKNTSIEMSSSSAPNIEVNKTSSSVEVKCESDVKVNDIKITLGILDFNDKDIEISRDVNYNGGEITNQGKTKITGSSSTELTSGDNVLEDLEIFKDPGVLVIGQDKLNLKNLAVNRGILDANNKDIEITGSADFSGGSVTNTNEVKFTGGENSELTTGGNFLKSVVVDKDGNAVISLYDALVAEVLEILKGKMKADYDIETIGKITVGNSGTEEGSLEIKPEKVLIANDTVIINKTGVVKLKADESKVGKLIPKKKIVKKPGGTFIAERKYSGDDEWHLVSSPISDATADIFGDDQLQYHTEADNSRTDIHSPSYPLEIMQGYFLSSTNTGYDSIDFNGTPNSGEQSFNFSYAGGSPIGDYGWNLIGNPYTATLDWDEVTIPANLDGTIYLFDPSIGENGDYVYYLQGAGSNTATQYVALAQGFFVHCSDVAGGTLTFTGDEMVANEATFYKSTEQAENSLILEVAGHESSKAEIRFLEGATPGFDGTYDVYRLFSESRDVPVIYSATASGKLAINTLPSIENHDLVTVGFKVGTMGTYTIGFSGIGNFEPSIPIYLHDTKEDVIIDIRQNNQYSFFYDTLDAPNRFVVCFTEATTTTQTISLANGWSGWSSYNSPDWKSSMEEIMAPVLNDMIITQYFNEIYYPLYGINTMGNFSNAHGYISKMNTAADLPNTGILADPTIELNHGWNLIPVISQCDVDVELLGALPELIIAYGIAGGGIYYPEYGINTINLMVPGAAYYVKVDGNTNFTFPACADASTVSAHKPLRPQNNTPWDKINYTGVSHTVVFEEDATSQLQPGDVIGAFTQSGLCTGIANITPGAAAGLNVFGDDITTSPIDGYADGEPLNFKIFRPECATQYNLDVVYDPSSPNAGGLFSISGLSIITNLTMSASNIAAHPRNNLNIYPNPSKGIFNITGNSLNQDIEVVVFNAHGQMVYQEKLIASQKIDISHQPSGVYFIQFISSTAIKTKKVVVE